MIRRLAVAFRPLGVVFLLLLVSGAGDGVGWGRDSGGSSLVTGVDAVGMTVSDMDRSVDFFSTVLSFEKLSDVELAGPDYEHLEGVFGLRMRVVRMRLGDESIELTQYLAPRGRPVPADSRSNDRWFQHVAIIVSATWTAPIGGCAQHKVEHASSGPQRLPDWNPNAAGIEAFYFKDPDGHPLEILQFPPDKGAAKWHATTDRLFLGIDHTAIVVADTEREPRASTGTRSASRSPARARTTAPSRSI